MIKYALFSFTTKNVGDEIQSIAAKRFLPRVDYYINRDYLNDFKPMPDDKIKIIMNGWYSHRPDNFPWKCDQIDPLLTSIYIADHAKEAFSRPENIEFFKKYGPVGARCVDTRDFLRSHGVDSYFSGCMSMTLNADPMIQKRDYVIALDVPEEVYQKIKRKSKYPVIRMNAFVTNTSLNTAQRFKLAKFYLYLYQSARLVITTRLHGTLPCLALGTKVLNLELPNFDITRFDSLREFSNHMTVSEFLEKDIDIDNPPENPKDFLAYREQLERTCSQYSGFNSSNSFLDGETVDSFLHDPELLQIIVNSFADSYSRWGATN